MVNARETKMKENVISEENIRQLVNDFYSKVRDEKELGSIFIKAIGNDSEEWKPHLQKLCDFWSSIMLGSRRYHGSPFQRHLMLPKFERVLFDHWLSLFEETTREIYTEEIADRFVEKSKQISKSLQLGLYQRFPEK